MTKPPGNRGVWRCSPDGIRTRATALRGRRARPLHNGALAVLPSRSKRSTAAEETIPVRWFISESRRTHKQIGRSTLGYKDSNLD